ncbi:MAG: hypothetical protein JWO48_2363 [Bryobacterales bacterium]|nr:hypothetical protein [Bryobacterales bacterium]
MRGRRDSREAGSSGRNPERTSTRNRSRSCDVRHSSGNTNRAQDSTWPRASWVWPQPETHNTPRTLEERIPPLHCATAAPYYCNARRYHCRGPHHGIQVTLTERATVYAGTSRWAVTVGKKLQLSWSASRNPVTLTGRQENVAQGHAVFAGTCGLLPTPSRKPSHNPPPAQPASTDSARLG